MTRRRNQESGFALLLVFAMSAAIAVMLYKELPRAAFEAQRAKEELLVDRGEQYIRGIQLYVAQWKSYPPTLDALEKTNGKRYLRRRYKDPMTGKDEWRAVHANGAGILVDSIVQKQGQQQEQKTQQTFISEAPSIGSTTLGTDAGQNIGLRRRPSDQNAAAGMGGGPTPPIDPQSLGNGAQVIQPGVPPQTGFPPQSGQPGMPDQPGQPGAPGAPGAPGGMPIQGMPPNGNNPFNPAQPQPGMPGNPNQYQPAGGNNPGLPYPVLNVPGVPGGPQQQPPQIPTMPGANGTPQPPYPPGGAAQPGRGNPTNAGLAMINQILTTPRGGMNMQVPGAPGLQIGGGIAGFASTYEAPAIKVYNERQKYNEWEFIYDVKNDKRLLGAAAGQGGVGMPQNQNPLGGGPLGGPLNNNNNNTGGGPNSPMRPTIPNPIVNPTAPGGRR